MALNPLDLRWQMVRDRWPIRVKNGSGAVIPPFSVVLISSSTSSNNEQLHTVVQPNAASTDWNWGNYLVTGPFQIGAGTSAEGLASTLAQPNYMRYDTGTPTKGQIYGPKHGQLTASLGYFGFEIQGGNTTFNSTNITVAKWVGIPAVLGKIDDTNVSLDGTCTVSVWAGTAGSETDSTMNITNVYNRAVALTSVNGKFCGVSRSGNTNLLMWVRCG